MALEQSLLQPQGSEIEKEYKFLVPKKSILTEIGKRKSLPDFKLLSLSHTPQTDHYLDQLSYPLLKALAGLRIRQKDHKLIAAFKQDITRYDNDNPTDSLFFRVESEQPIDATEYYSLCLGQSTIPPFTKAREIASHDRQFFKVLEIQNARTSMLFQSAETIVELSLDDLKFKQSAKAQKTLELELELKSGHLDQLKPLVTYLTSLYDLQPSSENKYLRGMKMMGWSGEQLVLNYPDGLEYAKYISDQFILNSSKPFIIAISGGSSSGKGEVEKELKNYLPNAKTLETDAHYKGKTFMLKNPDLTWDDPQAIAIDEIPPKLKAFKRGEVITQPIYSFKSGEREGNTYIPPSRSLIVEGFVALTDQIAQAADFRIFVKTSSYGRLKRRLMRDGGPMGRTSMTFTEIFKYFYDTVEPKHQQHVEKTSNNADLIILNEYDPKKEARRSVQSDNHLKYPLPDDLLTEDKLLNKGAKRISSTCQIDTFYSHQDEIGQLEFLRIRQENNGQLLATFKSKTSDKVTSRPRFDFPIDDQIKQLIETNYQKLHQIHKLRKLFQFPQFPQTLVALDHLLLVGDFLELRFDTDIRKSSPSSKKIIRELSQLLNLDPNKFVNKSYLEIVS